MLRILRHFFVTLGVIFFFLLIGAAYFMIIDPWHLRALLWSSVTGFTTELPVVPAIFSPNATATVSTTSASVATPAPVSTAETSIKFLNEAQKAALKKMGVNPDSLPATITAQQQACFVTALGQARVDEIMAGAVPTTFEFLRAAACLPT